MSNNLFYNLTAWIKENDEYFHPPLNRNRLMYQQQLKLLFVGGPNTSSYHPNLTSVSATRTYHIEKGEELFIQIKGDMCLKVKEKGQPKDVHIREGDIFLLPACIPHSPQRPANSVGLVIERERHATELDCLRYYCSDNKEVLWEKWIYCGDLVVDLPPVVKEYKASEQFRTQRPVKGFVKDPPYPIDEVTGVHRPFNLRKWLNANKREIQYLGYKWMFSQDFETGVIVYGMGENSENRPYDIWMWQLEGVSIINVGNKTYELETDDSLLIPHGERYKARRHENSLCLFVYMDFRKSM